MGFPLSIFTGGHLLLPYACLQQHSTLQDISKHSGFVAASSKVLFRGKSRDSSNYYFLKISDEDFFQLSAICQTLWLRAKRRLVSNIEILNWKKFCV